MATANVNTTQEQHGHHHDTTDTAGDDFHAAFEEPAGDVNEEKTHAAVDAVDDWENKEGWGGDWTTKKENVNPCGVFDEEGNMIITPWGERRYDWGGYWDTKPREETPKTEEQQGRLEYLTGEEYDAYNNGEQTTNSGNSYNYQHIQQEQGAAASSSYSRSPFDVQAATAHEGGNASSRSYRDIPQQGSTEMIDPTGEVLQSRMSHAIDKKANATDVSSDSESSDESSDSESSEEDAADGAHGGPGCSDSDSDSSSSSEQESESDEICKFRASDKALRHAISDEYDKTAQSVNFYKTWSIRELKSLSRFVTFNKVVIAALKETWSRSKSPFEFVGQGEPLRIAYPHLEWLKWPSLSTSEEDRQTAEELVDPPAWMTQNNQKCKAIRELFDSVANARDMVVAKKQYHRKQYDDLNKLYGKWAIGVKNEYPVSELELYLASKVDWRKFPICVCTHEAIERVLSKLGNVYKLELTEETKYLAAATIVPNPASPQQPDVKSACALQAMLAATTASATFIMTTIMQKLVQASGEMQEEECQQALDRFNTALDSTKNFGLTRGDLALDCETRSVLRCSQLSPTSMLVMQALKLRHYCGWEVPKTYYNNKGSPLSGMVPNLAPTDGIFMPALQFQVNGSLLLDNDVFEKKVQFLLNEKLPANASKEQWQERAQLANSLAKVRGFISDAQRVSCHAAAIEAAAKYETLQRNETKQEYVDKANKKSKEKKKEAIKKKKGEVGDGPKEKEDEELMSMLQKDLKKEKKAEDKKERKTQKRRQKKIDEDSADEKPAKKNKSGAGSADGMSDLQMTDHDLHSAERLGEQDHGFDCLITGADANTKSGIKTGDGPQVKKEEDENDTATQDDCDDAGQGGAGDLDPDLEKELMDGAVLKNAKAKDKKKKKKDKKDKSKKDKAKKGPLGKLGKFPQVIAPVRRKSKKKDDAAKPSSSSSKPSNLTAYQQGKLPAM